MTEEESRRPLLARLQRAWVRWAIAAFALFPSAAVLAILVYDRVGRDLLSVGVISVFIIIFIGLRVTFIIFSFDPYWWRRIKRSKLVAELKFPFIRLLRWAEGWGLKIIAVLNAIAAFVAQFAILDEWQYNERHLERWDYMFAVAVIAWLWLSAPLAYLAGDARLRPEVNLSPRRESNR